MRLLLLGGTGFVGRAIAEAAVERGIEVTAFNRGQAATPAGVTGVRGDRDRPDGLDALASGDWDAVIDTWTGAPAAVLAAARRLRDRVPHYTYISSRSVYTWPAPAGSTEDAEVVEAQPDDGSDVDYARAKRGGELAALEVYGPAALLPRPGLILGPYENIGRLPFWLRRIARGGTVPAPGPADLPLQYIDARDLAQWTLDAVERRLAGPYNVVSPAGHATMGEVLSACVEVTGSDATLHWLTPAAVAASGVQAWTELPLWLAPGPDHDALHRGDVSKVVAAGLRCRPVRETVADTWDWLQRVGDPPQRPDRPTPGYTPVQEAALLAAP